jgi:NAD(P)-dependent dehydrogenase (short-subunit alcohol dehydrogenase family)
MSFGFESTTDDVLDGIDLSGRQIVVTGASTGLGEETTRALAAHGAHITMAVRDLAKADEAAQRIRTAVPDAQLTMRQLDLGSLASVRRFADEQLAATPTLDVLINTSDGFETQFGTNHLGHFLLGVLLARALTAAGSARLVSLSSRGHAFAPVDLGDPNFEHTTYEPFLSYGRSKTANALFAVGYQARYGAQGVTALSVHPGGIHTELGRHMTPEVLKGLQERVESMGRSFSWKTIPQGAATSCWAATAPELVAHGGAYLEDCHVAEITDDPAAQNGVRTYAIDPATADALWAASEKWVGLA